MFSSPLPGCLPSAGLSPVFEFLMCQREQLASDSEITFTVIHKRKQLSLSSCWRHQLHKKVSSSRSGFLLALFYCVGFIPPFSSCPLHAGQKDVPFVLLIYSPGENKRITEQITKANFLSYTKQSEAITQATSLNLKDTAFWQRSGIRLGKENIKVLSLTKSLVKMGISIGSSSSDCSQLC